MAAPDFFPVLSASDIEQAAQLIYQAYTPAIPHASSGDTQSQIQHQLFEIQRRQEAWGLVIPFLESQDQNVQFFGAHTAQVKITRDWDSIPSQSVLQLRDLILELAGRSVSQRKNKIILRKLFVALTSLALKLVPGHPTKWPDWILSCVTSFSGHRSPPESILDFLTIVAEEMETADLLGASKMQVQQSMQDAIPMVIDAINLIIRQPVQSLPPQQLTSALKCLEAWLSIIPSSDLTPIIPQLILLLGPSTDDAFVAASDALQEVMSKSALNDGSGSKTLTEPLLLWLDQWGSSILQQPSGDPVPHSLCKLLSALGDHSTSYFAAHVASPALVITDGNGGKTKGHLTQTFLRLILSFTGLPGYYGEDEEESEMTLGFWYLFQEALWSTDYYFAAEGGEEEEDSSSQWGKDEQEKQKDRMDVAKSVYSQLVHILRRKVKFPTPAVAVTWSKDQVEKFHVYRRDIGDTLLNAYYILRGDMLGYYVNDLAERLSQPQREWEEIEATVHCIMAVQEGVPLEESVHLSRLFGTEILAQLPTSGPYRVRRTSLGLIGTYASWFTTHSKSTSQSTQNLLMNAITYVASGLSEPSLCLSAANALQELCDANRTALAPHINSFAELHAGLSNIPDTEKSKVLQSIASVIQALPPEEEIDPILAIVNPVIDKMNETLAFSSQLPEDARNLIILQLTTLTGVAKGLTRANDALTVLEDDETSEKSQAEEANLKRAREDPRMVLLRDKISNTLRRLVDHWGTDSGVSTALSDFFKAITALPSDTTLLTLPAGPLLELVCLSIQRQVNGVWLSLAGILIMQLNPPTLIPMTLKNSGPDAQTYALVGNVLPVILRSALSYLGVAGVMVDNPDVVQDFFGCMDTIAKNFVVSFYRLPSGALDALMQCAISSLALQERYSLVAACNFLSSLINRTYAATSSPPATPPTSLSPTPTHEDLGELPPSAYTMLIETHGPSIMRAVLAGFAGIAPRSSSQNLIELLATMLSRCGDQAKGWVKQILFSDDFVPSKATPEAKEKFYKVLCASRSIKRTREAAQQFLLVARGLEGTSFGYSSAL